MILCVAGKNRITLDFARCVQCEPKLKPGGYICSDCRCHAIQFFEWKSPSNSNTSSPQQARLDDDLEFTDSQEIRNSSFKQLSDVATTLGKSPVQSKTKLNMEQRQALAMKQMKKIIPAVAEQVSVAYKTPKEDPMIAKQTADDYEILIKEIKSKFEESDSFMERKQLITLLPISWTRETIMFEMNCSSFLAKESIRLRQEVGIFPKLKTKSGQKLIEKDVATVVNFYEENSRTRYTYIYVTSRTKKM